MSREACYRGHDLTREANRYEAPDGSTQCRPCARLAGARKREKRRELVETHGLDLPADAPLYLIRQRIAQQEAS